MTCARCLRSLSPDETHASFTVQQERETRDGVVVEASTLLLATCVPCAPTTDDAAAALQALLAPR